MKTYRQSRQQTDEFEIIRKKNGNLSTTTLISKLVRILHKVLTFWWWCRAAGNIYFCHSKCFYASKQQHLSRKIFCRREQSKKHLLFDWHDMKISSASLSLFTPLPHLFKRRGKEKRKKLRSKSVKNLLTVGKALLLVGK